MPIDYRFPSEKAPAYGQWEAYVPGPGRLPAWVSGDDAAGGADAVAAGGVYPVGAGPRLLTPLGPG